MTPEELRRQMHDETLAAQRAQWAARAAEEEDRTRRIVLTPASAIAPRPVRWLWDTTPPGEFPTSHGRIPMDAVSLAGGPPGVGKSQFAAWIAAKVTTGKLYGHLYGQPRDVVYAATEDSWAHTIVPRLIAVGADLERVHRIAVVDETIARTTTVTLPVDVIRLGKVMQENGAKLFIADPLISLLDGKINDNRSTEIREAVQPLVDAADRFEFSVLGLMHFTKNGGADPLARISGSGAFGQLVRAAIAFARDDSDEDDRKSSCVMSQIKNNLGRLDLPSLEYEIESSVVNSEEGSCYSSKLRFAGNSATSVRDILRDQADGRDFARADARLWLVAHLAELGGSVPAPDALKAGAAAGFSRATMYRVRKDLGIVSRLSAGRSPFATWYLPEAAP